jgi:hypothetical protein
MAGGNLAAEVACMVCLFDHGRLTKATRIAEGDETDRYRCAKGHEHGVDWPMPATEPQWPPPAELAALATNAQDDPRGNTR